MYLSIYLGLYTYIYILDSSVRAGYDTSRVFKQSFTGLNSEFSFSNINCHTKVKVPSLSYYLPIVGERIAGFLPITDVLALWEMQTASSRI